MTGTVAIDCFPESVKRYQNGYAVVAVDVIRATTTAVTAVALGRKCFPVPSLEDALAVGATKDNPLLMGELGGNKPYGFDMNNSPAELETRTDIERPIILLSTSGTRLLCSVQRPQPVYVASLRNLTAQIAHLARHHSSVAVIGAGSRGEFREEDQLCCAWIAEGLLRAGYRAANAHTEEIVERWRGCSVDAALNGRSAQYLRATGQASDLEFVREHVDDLDIVYQVEEGEVVADSGRSRIP